MTARASSRAGAFDPSEWAARRKSAVEKAARLREERKRGHLDDTCTFAPQTNTDSNSGSRSSSRQEDNDIDGSYTSEPSQQRSYGRTGSDASGQEGYSDMDDSSNHEYVSRRGPIAPQGNARPRTNFHDGDDGPELQEVYRPPRRAMASEPSEMRMQSNPMRGQSSSEPPEVRVQSNPMRAQERGPVGRGGRLGAQAPRENAQQSREARDLQDGYRDKAFNQPIAIKFAGRGGVGNRGHAGPPAADSGPAILDRPEDREAHDTFTTLLRGEEAPLGGGRGGRRASGGRKPDWNSDMYTPTVMEDEPPPLPARPNRRGSRSSLDQPAPRRQVAPPPPEDDDEKFRDRGRGRPVDIDSLPVGKGKQGRPDWIDSWEEQAEASGGRRAEPRREEPKRQEPRREEARREEARGQDVPRQRVIQRPRDEEDENDDDQVLSADARPKLSLLKAKLRNGKAGRRTQSAPTSVEDLPVVQDSPRHAMQRGPPLSSGLGALREADHLPPANQRFRRDQATRAQTTPVVLGGAGLRDAEEDEEEVRGERKVRSGIRPPMGKPLAPPKPQVSPRTNRLAKASAMGHKARAGSFGQREEEEEEDRPIAIKVRQEDKRAGGWGQGKGKGRVPDEYEEEEEEAPIQQGRMGGGSSAFEGGMPEEDDAMLIPCPSCGRKFVERAFRVHQKVCKKVFQSKRKAFDSRKARVEGTEAAKYVKGLPNPLLSKAAPSAAAAAKPGMRRGSSGTSQMSSDSGAPWEAPPAPKKALPRPMAKRAAHENTPIKTAGGDKSKWRQQSEAFRQMLKQNRMIKEAEDSGKPIPTFAAARSEPDPSLIQCPHCSRRFNEQAAERHIPKCQSIVAKPKPLSKGTGIQLGAAARQLARQSSGSSLGGGGGGMGRRPLGGRR